MSHKTAYLWGPISSFSAYLAALLLQKGWQLHIATKSAFNLLSLAPLDLTSAAELELCKALGGWKKLRIFKERLRFIEHGEVVKGTKYDAFVFAGLPPNFDESRVPRAPWAAERLTSLLRHMKGVPTFLISSLWGGIQKDGTVPEELELERRKPLTHWESVCQRYEEKLLNNLHHIEASWHLVRLPIISGTLADGTNTNFNGLFSLLHSLSEQKLDNHSINPTKLKINMNPNSSLPFLPVDYAANLFWRFIEDELRPRICNFVSAQSPLNREWVEALATALGFEGSETTENDPYNLTVTVRRMLNDNILPKTRNLFEIVGRYHLSPVRLDKSYFCQLLAYGQSENWGRLV